MPDGKPENTFGFDGAYQDSEFAIKVPDHIYHKHPSHKSDPLACMLTILPKVIEETHVFWQKLVGLQQPAEEPGRSPLFVQT